MIGPPARHPLLWYYWFNFSVTRALKKIRPDLFLSPDGYLSLKTRFPQIAVIHDINFYHRPQDLPLLSRWYYNHFFPKFTIKANRIVTVSEYTKNDICESYGILPDKIDVACNGAHELYKVLSELDKKGAKARYSIGCEYFVFIGAQHPRKNIEGLLRAFDQFKSKYETGHKLIIVGEKKFLTDSIEDTYKEMNFRNEVLFTGRLSSEEIVLVLGSAGALIFIPFFEGFGIPLVEAMYAEVPIVASEVTSIPEVAGDAALYVDPENKEAIVEAMHNISTNDELRASLIANGRVQRLKFTWDKSAEILWQSIERVCRLQKHNNS